MVSITGISAEQAVHYYSKKDNYYAKEQGLWQGKGARALGLSGEVMKEDFERLLNREDKEGKQLFSEGVSGEHRAGIDLTFSAPKSVSILSEVIGDERIRDAHEKAVETTLKYIEKRYSQTRQVYEKGQRRKVHTGNLAIAKFNHDTSRELDPQLHTHTVIMNMTRRKDGEWRALSNEALYENKMFIGQIYRNELAARLKKLGYSIQGDNKGLFEVIGMPKELIAHYSQRSEQIDERVRELKESGRYSNASEQRLREIAALGSRVAKKDVDINLVRQAWDERLKQQGYTKDVIEQAVKEYKISRQAEEEKKKIRLKERDYIRLACSAVTEEESAFKKEDVLKIAGKLSVSEYRIPDLEKAFDELNRKEAILSLDEESGVYTTKEMKSVEGEIVQKVKDGHDKMRPIVMQEQIEIELEKYQKGNSILLTSGQKQAAEHILSSKDRIIGVQGDAGTGKTTMLAVVREQAEAKGYEIKGLSFTGKAASEIEQTSGIKSQTVHAFLGLGMESNKGGKDQVWIVDEASMIGSKQMNEIIKSAELQNARVVLIGDTKQLQSIKAGQIFKDLQDNGMKTVEMKEILRQDDPAYKDIVKDIAAKRIESAFTKLESNNCVAEIKDRQARLEAVVKDYASVKDYTKALIVTARNADRTELNTLIRNELRTQDRLSEEDKTFTVREPSGLAQAERHFAQVYKEGDYVFSLKAGIIGRAGNEGKIASIDPHYHHIMVEKENGRQHTVNLKQHGQDLQVYNEKQQVFTEGDRIVFLKNDKALNVKNGATGTIQSIDERTGNFKIQTDAERDITLNINHYPYIDHGYAVTDYKSQGQTAKEVIYHADTTKEVSYNQAYVAVTRGKTGVKVYTDSKDNLKEMMKQEQVKETTLANNTKEAVKDMKEVADISKTVISKESPELVYKSKEEIIAAETKECLAEITRAVHDTRVKNKPERVLGLEG